MNAIALRFFKKFGYRHSSNTHPNSFYAIIENILNDEFPGVEWRWRRDENGYLSIVEVISGGDPGTELEKLEKEKPAGGIRGFLLRFLRSFWFQGIYYL